MSEVSRIAKQLHEATQKTEGPFTGALARRRAKKGKLDKPVRLKDLARTAAVIAGSLKTMKAGGPRSNLTISKINRLDQTVQQMKAMFDPDDFKEALTEGGENKLMGSLNFGDMPSRAEFDKAWEVNVEGQGYDSYPVNMKGADAKFFDSGDYTQDELWEALHKLQDKIWDHEEAGSLFSDILTTLGFETH